MVLEQSPLLLDLLFDSEKDTLPIILSINLLFDIKIIFWIEIWVVCLATVNQQCSGHFIVPVLDLLDSSIECILVNLVQNKMLLNCLLVTFPDQRLFLFGNGFPGRRS